MAKTSDGTTTNMSTQEQEPTMRECAECGRREEMYGSETLCMNCYADANDDDNW